MTTSAFISKLEDQRRRARRLAPHVSYAETAMDLRTHPDQNHNILEEWRFIQQEKKDMTELAESVEPIIPQHCESP